MAPPRDTLSRSWGGPQPKSQPAFLPDQIVRQGVLQRRPAFRKFNFHTDSADVEAVQIFGNLQKPCDALFAGKGCKNLVTRSLRERALSKVIPLTSGRDSGETAPMSTLFICSSSCAVNLTVKPPLFRLINASRLSCGETRKGGTAQVPPFGLSSHRDTMSRS